ncbi:hypothetical protein [Hyphococcus lacteus]|uniref:Uncharacterized protein n=1 Tax=Hyphococcus lacteus TaxID=3143536 RepID=A0ABV3Z6Z8_9PROT
MTTRQGRVTDIAKTSLIPKANIAHVTPIVTMKPISASRRHMTPNIHRLMHIIDMIIGHGRDNIVVGGLKTGFSSTSIISRAPIITIIVVMVAGFIEATADMTGNSADGINGGIDDAIMLMTTHVPDPVKVSDRHAATVHRGTIIM